MGPQVLRGRLEEQVAGGGQDGPGARRQLALELAGPPPGVAAEHADAEALANELHEWCYHSYEYKRDSMIRAALLRAYAAGLERAEGIARERATNNSSGRSFVNAIRASAEAEACAAAIEAEITAEAGKRGEPV